MSSNICCGKTDSKNCKERLFLSTLVWKSMRLVLKAAWNNCLPQRLSHTEFNLNLSEFKMFIVYDVFLIFQLMKVLHKVKYIWKDAYQFLLFLKGHCSSLVSDSEHYHLLSKPFQSWHWSKSLFWNSKHLCNCTIQFLLILSSSSKIQSSFIETLLYLYQPKGKNKFSFSNSCFSCKTFRQKHQTI